MKLTGVRPRQHRFEAWDRDGRNPRQANGLINNANTDSVACRMKQWLMRGDEKNARIASTGRQCREISLSSFRQCKACNGSGPGTGRDQKGGRNGCKTLHLETATARAIQGSKHELRRWPGRGGPVRIARVVGPSESPAPGQNRPG